MENKETSAKMEQKEDGASSTSTLKATSSRMPSVSESLLDKEYLIAHRNSLYGDGTKVHALHKPVSKNDWHPYFNVHNLPYVVPWMPYGGSGIQVPPNFNPLTENCGFKSATGIVLGSGMGLVLGVFMSAMSDMTPPVTVINGKEVPQAPLKEQMRTTLRATGEKCLYYSRSFAFITGIFSGSECVIEKARGKEDVWNQVLSGCVTGAAMQAKQGPQAAAIGEFHCML